MSKVDKHQNEMPFYPSDSHSILLCPSPACFLLPGAPPLPTGACLSLRAQPSTLRANPALCSPTPEGALDGPHSCHLSSHPRPCASLPLGTLATTPLPLCPGTSGSVASLDAVALPEHSIIWEGVAHIHVNKHDVQRLEPGLLLRSLWVEPGVED